MNRTSSSQQQTLTGGVRKFLGDLLSLGELQLQLFQVDLRDGKSRLIKAGILLGIAPVLGLAALPVLFLGSAAVIAESFAWRLAYTQLGLAAGVILMAAVLGWWGVHKLVNSLATLSRSRHEFSENIAWLKSTLTDRETPDATDAEHYPHRYN